MTEVEVRKEGRCYAADWEDGERGQSQGMQVVPRSWERQGTKSALEPSGPAEPCHV